MNVKTNALPYIPDYIIESVLGEGGMATVYLGIQLKLQRKVAIKILDPALLKNKILADRFMIEAQTAANLNHPNIISIYDVGQVGKYYYIVMELLDGSLKDLLKSAPGRKLPPPESLNIISKIAPALDYAHKQGIIHRDIKPDNIMFRQDGTPVLVDFGIARAVDTDLQMTKTGMGIGTPHYMSPEQCQTGPIDGRSDFYSLGIVFYELLTGEKPYRAETILAVALKQIQEPVPTLPGYLVRYQPILDKMMAKNKENRVENGIELQRLIDEALKVFQPESPPTSSPAPSTQTFPLPQPTIEKDIHTPTNYTPAVETNLRRPTEVLIKTGEIIQPDESLDGEDAEEPIILHESIEENSIKENSIINGPSSPGSPVETNYVQPMKGTQFEDAVPDWFRESLERTLPVDAADEPVTRKPYKDKPKEKFISHTFLIFLLIITIVGTVTYLFYQGAGSDSQKVNHKSDTPTKKDTAPQHTHQVQDNMLIGSQTIKNNQGFNGAKDNNTDRNPEKKNPGALPEAPIETKIKDVKPNLVYSLRNVYHILSQGDVESIIKRYGFFDKNHNSLGQFPNVFEKKDINGHSVIIDHITGLMWHPGGSDRGIEQKRIPRWFKDFNSKQYAGFTDWRLPTLEEAASLLKNSQTKTGLYIDPLFSPRQKHIWTGDKFETNNLWLVFFNTGIVLSSEDAAAHFIRPVRST